MWRGVAGASPARLPQLAVAPQQQSRGLCPSPYQGSRAYSSMAPASGRAVCLNPGRPRPHCKRTQALERSTYSRPAIGSLPACQARAALSLASQVCVICTAASASPSYFKPRGGRTSFRALGEGRRVVLVILAATRERRPV